MRVPHREDKKAAENIVEDTMAPNLPTLTICEFIFTFKVNECQPTKPPKYPHENAF